MGFRGQFWEKGTIVEVGSNEKPPKHFVPIEQVVPDQPKVEPHRTEAKEVMPGKTLEVKGGMAAGLKKQRLKRIMTIDEVPNQVVRKLRGKSPKKKHGN